MKLDGRNSGEDPVGRMNTAMSKGLDTGSLHIQNLFGEILSSKQRGSERKVETLFLNLPKTFLPVKWA